MMSTSIKETVINCDKYTVSPVTWKNIQSKQCLFADEDDLSDDDADYLEKPIQDWSRRDTVTWLLCAANHLGQHYCSIKESLSVPGKDLILMTRDNFKRHDETYGEKLYDLLHSQDLSESWKYHCIFADEDDLSDDDADYLEKPVKDWSRMDTVNWLLCAADHLGQHYCSIKESLCVPGKDLILMTKDDFKRHDGTHGEKFYDLLHFQDSLESLHISSEDEFPRSCNLSDVESDSKKIARPKRSPGGPRKSKCKSTSNTYGKLWQFIAGLLHNPETCPSLICWEDYSQGKFRFVRNHEVAKMWGARRNKEKNLSYENFSRAMRYYYEDKFLAPVNEKRLVFKFGENAKGWQTDNPILKKK